MSYAHTKALKELLLTIPQFAGRVHVTLAEGAVAPYVVIHPESGVNTQERVTGPHATRNPRFTLHVVGKSGEQVQILSDAVEQALFPGGRGIRIDVTGERGKPVWFEQPLPIQVQTDPQPTVVYAVIETGWQSDPA